MMAGAKAALYDTELVATLEARYRIPSLDSLMAKYRKPGGLSGDALYEQVVQDIKNLFQTRYPEQVGGCFIAGTLVHTDKGLVPIEQIKVGDMVLSQPEQGGITYKPVVNTFVFEDKPICVVKYQLIDGDVPYGHPKYYPKDDTLHHLYATPNHPFWVEGTGWTAAEELQERQILQLRNGQRALVEYRSQPVIRSTQPGFGRVCSNPYSDGQEVHIVDFRNGSSLWKYERWKPELASAPYQEGYPLDEIVALSKILDGTEPAFKTTVYNLEVEDFHTYYVGELGVWVHGT